MFDRNSYREDCARLTLGQEKIQEMITMTENKKKRFGGHPVRTVILAAALAACLGLTAFAATPAGQEVIQGIIVTFTYTEMGDNGYILSLKDDVVGYVGDMGDLGVVSATVLPTLDYEERDGRQILILDGEELDVTEAMEKDGFYERELEGASLRVAADGTATVTIHNEDGEVGMSYTVYLGEDASVSFGAVSNTVNVDIVSEPGGYTEVTGIYSFTGEGAYTATDSDGNVVVVEAGNLPE